MQLRTLPTEPIGSIPRSKDLLEAIARSQAGKLADADLERIMDSAVRETINLFEQTGSPVITDGEQRKPSFATYPIHGMKDLRPMGVVIPFKDGHTRQLPVLSGGPFRYTTYAVTYLKKAQALTQREVKQAVISASALSLLYPSTELKNYPRAEFMKDLASEAVKDIRLCLDQKASVQIDFTEARLSLKLDPSKKLLKSFIDLNNQVLDAFTESEREMIGVHTCPGGDHDSTHSADVDYADLLPDLFQMNVGRFFVQLSSERDRKKVLKILKGFAKGKRRIYVGVTDPLSSRIEKPDEILKQILEAAEYIPPSNLGTTDDCGFSPFCDDTSTSRETAFAKIRARVTATQQAAIKLRL